MKTKKTPQRRCVGCNIMKDKKELIRVVRSATGEVTIDKIGKKPGRGAYVCPDAECVSKAVKEKRLEKALEVAIDKEIYEKLLGELAND
ncbi:MAG: YlxR family protein [Acholeplasmataceae bacterium]|nr:YlxR family protein [Acidaminococcaceae bacterium]NLY84581.1 YlxR family protein [Acholeplasmataceae bacterium]